MHLDWTISIGDIIKSTSLFVLAVLAWSNLRWRVNNLEIWRKEHMIDSDSRDEIIKSIEKLVGRLDTLLNDRRTFIRSEHPSPYGGEERRRK